MTKHLADSDPPPVEARLILYVTDNSPRSSRARANLKRMIQAMELDYGAVAEVDLLHEPKEALRAGVFATPALTRPGDGNDCAHLYGDLSDEETLRSFLLEIAE